MTSAPGVGKKTKNGQVKCKTMVTNVTQQKHKTWTHDRLPTRVPAEIYQHEYDQGGAR